MKTAWANVVVMILLVACSAQPGQSGGTPEPTADATPTFIASAAATLTASPEPLATVEASLAATEAPTASTTPTEAPTPTLNWDANGCMADVRSPVDLGSKANVVLKCPVGPTCVLKVKYPSGSSANVPAPTNPKPGWWRWNWTVPKSATAGKATGTATCTYAGVPHTGPITIKLVDPAVPGGYSIKVTSPASRAWNDTDFLRFTVKVTGTVPSSPTYGVTLTCNFDLTSANGNYHVNMYTSDFAYANGSGPFVTPFDIGNILSVDWIGTATWTYRCRNTYVPSDSWKQDTGTIEITA